MASRPVDVRAQDEEDDTLDRPSVWDDAAVPGRLLGDCWREDVDGVVEGCVSTMV